MAISSIPEGFNPHRLIKKVYQQRPDMSESGEGVDWAMAEALAFGTLLSEGGCPVFCWWCDAAMTSCVQRKQSPEAPHALQATMCA